MTNTEYSDSLYYWHKSLGVIFALIVGIRLYWRVKNPWPSQPLASKFERIARDRVHHLLVLLLLAMPITGLLSSAYSSWSVHLFEMIIIPKNMNSAGEDEPFNETIYQCAKLSHRLLAYLFSILICAHIAAVLKHHFINKDNTLINMIRGK